MVKEKLIPEVLEKKIGTSKNYVALATVNPKSYQKINIEIIRYLVQDKKIPGVYVTLNKPFRAVFEILKTNNVNTEIIIFIDAVTKTAGGTVEKTNKCLFIGNPENLSDISMAMDQAIRRIPSDGRFLFFDSLDTLLIYNKPITVAKFIHFLATKMRIWGVRGIIISLSNESNKELIDELSQFCDVRLEI